jgi:hypothetical protein
MAKAANHMPHNTYLDATCTDVTRRIQKWANRTDSLQAMAYIAAIPEDLGATRRATSTRLGTESLVEKEMSIPQLLGFIFSFLSSFLLSLVTNKSACLVRPVSHCRQTALSMKSIANMAKLCYRFPAVAPGPTPGQQPQQQDPSTSVGLQGRAGPRKTQDAGRDRTRHQ